MTKFAKKVQRSPAKETARQIAKSDGGRDLDSYFGGRKRDGRAQKDFEGLPANSGETEKLKERERYLVAVHC